MKIEISSSNPSAGSTPFLSQALERGLVELGDYYEVFELHESRSRAGWMIKTDVFSVFLFKSNGLVESLIEKVEALVNSNPACAILLQVNNTTVEGFSIFLDDETTRMWAKSKKDNILDRYQCRQALSVQKIGTKSPKK